MPVQTEFGRFEMADGGTLFLDEIANVPLRQQAKLLRVWKAVRCSPWGRREHARVNIRIVSATNANLQTNAPPEIFAKTSCFA